MSHPFRHFALVARHRYHVRKNARHLGIYFLALRHDLSKYGPKEFWPSARYYAGNHSPVYEERLHSEGRFSWITLYHVKHNPHHWEYWVEFCRGDILAKAMPWKYAMEYVADVLSASYTYDPKAFTPASAYDYFLRYHNRYFLAQATDAFLQWCFATYRDAGWNGLKPRLTKAKYQQFLSLYGSVSSFSTIHSDSALSPIQK
ncbi:MAG: DUF5662 family protein [Erysipelotrichaceae bacterium]|nr:DUF5662 family protein [Erysipelotrichaceae bacterium]